MVCEVEQKCQWNHCESQASKHAVVGLNVFDARDDAHTSEAPYTPQHFDLCEQHLELARLQYVHVSEYALGACPRSDRH